MVKVLAAVIEGCRDDGWRRGPAKSVCCERGVAEAVRLTREAAAR